MPIKILFSFLLCAILFSCTTHVDDDSYTTAEKLEKMLNEHTLELWYPRIIDENNGGYYSNYSYNWIKDSIQNKFLVTQARHVWTLSRAYQFYPERLAYKKHAHHGFEFLRDHLWDTDFGGFFQLVDSTGKVPMSKYALEKRAYGNAFAIYGLAAYYKISKEEGVLNLAIDAFKWFDEHAHDTEFGGYFQFLQQDGTPIPRAVLQEGYNAGDKVMVGLKDYNSSIHILEAFTELHQVWPDNVLHERLSEMYDIVSNTMFDPRGFLKLNFYPDWTEVEDEEIISVTGGHGYHTSHVTFGHDVETAFLLIEAAEELEIDKTKILPKAKLFVDHALKMGWDVKKGGFYEQGKYVSGKMKIIDKGKNWWAQAEGLNSLLLMHILYPNDPQNYYLKFELLYEYINQNMIDHQYKGWYSWGSDYNPETKRSSKANIWKGTYHTSRSLFRCIAMLNEEEMMHSED